MVGPAHDDFELLRVWREGDRRAGSELFDRHFDAIYRFFDRKTGAESADLVQSTFLACLEAKDRFQGTSSFRTFLFAIARHELYAHFRRRRREAQIDFGVSSILDLGASPSAEVNKVDELRRLVSALQSIPVDQQIVLELYYIQGLRGADLALVLEVPEGTVRSRLRRAQEALRSHLDEGGAPEVDGALDARGGSLWEPHLAELFRAL